MAIALGFRHQSVHSHSSLSRISAFASKFTMSRIRAAAGVARVAKTARVTRSTRVLGVAAQTTPRPVIPFINFHSIRSHSTSAHAEAPKPSLDFTTIPVESTYDIVVIGGANAGLALACALRKSSATLSDRKPRSVERSA